MLARDDFGKTMCVLAYHYGYTLDQLADMAFDQLALLGEHLPSIVNPSDD